jgi:phage tail-like protein
VAPPPTGAGSTSPRARRGDADPDPDPVTEPIQSALAPLIEGVEVQIEPAVIEVELLARPSPAPLDRLRPLWHTAPNLPQVNVTLKSSDQRPRRVRLGLTSDGTGWTPEWVRWLLPVRAVGISELEGGDAVAAQDVLSDDETTVTVLLMPKETREIVLEFRAFLDGATPADDFDYDLLIVDANDGSAGAIAGTVKLRHPTSVLETHLPSIYSDDLDAAPDHMRDDKAGPFFRRFLRGFDDAEIPMRKLLDNLHRFFDAFEAAPDFLPWLATWVGIVLDENWPEMKRRRLIREAVELYRWRGTRRGLARYLEIYAGVRPEINDQPFRGMRLGPNTRLGVDLSDPARLAENSVLGDVPDHSFVVTIATPDPKTINETTVRDIIEVQKPAHAAYVARIVRRAPDAEAAA